MLDLPFSGRRGVQKVITTSVRDCAIESVVVFADRAEVRRAVPVTLAAGENEVVIYGLSSCMDTNSIRFGMCSESDGVHHVVMFCL